MDSFDNPAVKNRRRGWLAAAGVALLALIYSLFWFTIAMQARQQAVDWIDQQRAQGYSVRYDSLIATGFPLAIRLQFTNPGFGAPNAAQPWGWEGAHLSLQVQPWNLTTIEAISTGPHMLAIPLTGKTETFNGQAATLEATFEVSPTGPQSLSLRLAGLDMKADSPGLAPIAMASANVQVQRSHFDKVDYQTSSARLTGTVRGFGGPWLSASPLGGEVQQLVVEARLMGSLEDAPLSQSLEDWRDNGGTIEIVKMHLQHGPLNIKADGTLALDDHLQPIGALSARVEGFFETIDALKALGAINPRTAITAKIVLGVLSRKPAGGGPAILNLALSAQGQRLYAGPLELMKIPEIQWP